MACRRGGWRMAVFVLVGFAGSGRQVKLGEPVVKFRKVGGLRLERWPLLVMESRGHSFRFAAHPGDRVKRWQTALSYENEAGCR